MKTIIASITIAVVAVFALVYWKHNTDVVTIDREALGDTVAWLDDKGTIYVPKGKALEFNEHGERVLLWWDTMSAALCIERGGDPKRHVTLQQTSDRFRIWRVAEGIEIIAVYPDVWIVVAGRDRLKGSS